MNLNMETVEVFGITTSIAEIIGICASVLVIVSFLMKRVPIIRITNIIACTVFVIYGLIISAFSIWFLNGFLILVHILYLIRGAVGKNNKPRRLSAFKKTSFNKDSYRRPSWFLDSDLS